MSPCRVVSISLVVAALACLPPVSRAVAKGGANAVDVELVLAVDISYSMDEEEQHLQRNGYIAALQSPEFLKALKAGPNGRIAVVLHGMGEFLRSENRRKLDADRRRGNGDSLRRPTCGSAISARQPHIYIRRDRRRDPPVRE